MEKWYSLIKKARVYIYGTVFVFAVSRLIDVLEETSISNISTSLEKLLDLDKLSNDMFLGGYGNFNAIFCYG